MILVDFSGVVFSRIVHSETPQPMSLDETRHVILAALREIRVKFPNHGTMVICCDNGSWRRDVFPQYKARRRETRANDGIDYASMWESVNTVLDEIDAHIPWLVIRQPNTEADDIIGTLVHHNPADPIMIVSRDKDFIQLHGRPNVYQYDPITKTRVYAEDARRYAFEHLIRGDVGDGIPNILSEDNCLSDRIRQKSITKKVLADFISEDSSTLLTGNMDADTIRRLKRNLKLISLSHIPDEIVNGILDGYEKSNSITIGTPLEYFINKNVNFKDMVGDFR